jgi:hypothetical protein
VLQELKALKGRKAIIPHGKYAGRVGVVGLPRLSLIGSQLDVSAMIRPLRLRDSPRGKKGGPLDDGYGSHIDVRTYWNLEEVEFLEGVL